MMRKQVFATCWTLLIWVPIVTAAENDVSIVMPEAKRGDTGLACAVDDLGMALKSVSRESTRLFRRKGDPLPAGEVILLGNQGAMPGTAWQPPRQEAFRVRPVKLAGKNALLVEGDDRGLMYGVFKLAERIRVTGCPWQVKLEESPAFATRMFSEEGQLLNIPDRGYHDAKPPYVNRKRLRKEVDQLKHLCDHVARLGYNALVVMHVNFEEYIDYRYLDKEIYPKNDPHRQRSPVFCEYLTRLCDHAHARHMELYLQVYEFQYPPQLEARYPIDLNSPKTERIIRAKVRELFERVPLDGLVLTCTETNPRTGYRSKQLWKEEGRRGAGKMATLYYNACHPLGKRCLFRLWHVVKQAEHVPELVKAAPPEVEMAIKNTGNDYYAGWPMTDALTSALPREQPLTVLFDTFREYDGWSRLFVYKKSWRERVQVCRDQGVVGVNAWGPWAEKCITSDNGGKISWAGHWNQFRTFVNGFTPGQANVYLLARLAWDPDADTREIARDFAAFHLGQANADAAAEAIMLTEEPFAEYAIGHRAEIVPPNYIKWSMVFHPVEQLLEEAYQHTKPEDIYRKNARALKYVQKMEEAFARTDATLAPDADRYARFQEGVEKTALYLRTLYTWREAWWRNRAGRDLQGGAKVANATALAETKVALEKLFANWNRFPEEARYWRVTFRQGLPQGIPKDSFLYWYFKGKPTMESTAAAF